MIGVARPTRGLEFTESSDSIQKNLEGIESVIERTWNDPIPDGFNKVVALLLQYKQLEAVWFVEEDVVVPPYALRAMMDKMIAGCDIVAVNYFLKRQEGVISEKRDDDGNILWVSLGCTLVRADVFKKLPEPWFQVGYTVASVHCGSSCKKRTYKLVKNNYPYGGQDAYFCWKAREAGFQIGVIDNLVADHLILDGLGQSDSNFGVHRINRVKRSKKEKRIYGKHEY